MRAADAVFALTELRGAIMAQRVRAMARDHVRSLRIGKSAGKQQAGVHQRSVRCDARECTENVRLGAVAHGRLVCNKTLRERSERKKMRPLTTRSKHALSKHSFTV